MTKIDFIRWRLLEKPTIRTQFKQWLKLQDSEPEAWSSCDFETQGVKLLFRNNTNGINSNCMTIATVRFSTDIQNKGVFKSLLNYVVRHSPWDVIAIEDVDNPILRDFCLKYGFQPINLNYSSSFYIKKSQLPKFEVKKFCY